MAGRARELPDFDWPDETIAWFESWRDSQRSETWDEAQWQYLYDTALVHAAVWGGDMSLLPELRTRLQYMGLRFDAAPTAEAGNAKKEKTTLEIIQGRRAEKARRARAANQD